MEQGGAEMEDQAVLRYVRVVAAYEGKEEFEMEVGDVLAVVEEKPATGWCVPRAGRACVSVAFRERRCSSSQGGCPASELFGLCRYGGFKLRDPEHAVCWFPMSHVRQVRDAISLPPRAASTLIRSLPSSPPRMTR
jgi:hypothetical protein